MDDGEPPDKKRHLNMKECILCFKSRTKCGIIVKNPTLDGLKTILTVCKKQKDNVYELLSPIEDKILSNDIHVCFHKLLGDYTSFSQQLYV